MTVRDKCPLLNNSVQLSNEFEVDGFLILLPKKPDWVQAKINTA
jgi:hypothetical protein